MSEPLPVVVFSFNRPQKLRRILDALHAQSVERVVIFVDGPRHADDLPQVEACRSMARGVDWAPVELHLWEDNRGLNGFIDNISLVMDTYPWAIFVEDDCLPMPGFYAFMRHALEQYADCPEIFSIGGYQPLPMQYLKHNPDAVVSCARFTCWGWATWRNRWQALLPDVKRYADLFDGLRCVPDIAGADLPEMARAMALGRIAESWDVKVAISCLNQRRVHLLATRGLVRNIGLDRSGVHGSLRAFMRGRRLLNQNLVENLPAKINWPENVELDCDYAADLKKYVDQTRFHSLRRLWDRSLSILRRYLLSGYERRFDLDLLEEPHQPLQKRALFSYIVHPFSITPDDPRFLRHNNILYAQEIVRVLNRVGYRVDVIDYRDTSFIPRANYDLFIGHGGFNYYHLARALCSTCLKLYFSTGAYWRFHNLQEQARFEALYKRRDVTLPLDRYIDHGEGEEEALSLANGIIGVGNDFTRATYSVFPNVIMINNSVLPDDHFDWCSKDYQAGRMHFLYYSGKGCVHKGLDLLLEAFAGLEQHLWICSFLEPQFAKAYSHELHNLANIHLVGWIQPRSKVFYRIMQNCNFCILPSASEGGAQSVVESMNQGLIPLVSKSCGLEVGGIGGYIEPCTIDIIRMLVVEFSSYTAEKCCELSHLVRFRVQNDFSTNVFSRRFEEALKRSLVLHESGLD